MCLAAKSRLTLQPLDCSPPDSFLEIKGFPRQEYWSGLPLPSPGDLPGIEPMSPASPADRYLTAEPPGKPRDQKSEIQVSAGQFLLRFEGVSDPCLSPTTQQRVVSSSSQAAYEKKPQTGHLKLQTFIFPQIWRLEAHDQGVSTFSFWLPDHCLLSVSSRGGKRENCSVSPYSHQDSSPSRLK